MKSVNETNNTYMEKKKNKKIGIFDSGIGGVTVLKEIIKLLPNEDCLFYSDSKNNPYGDKNENEIKKICDKIVEFLIKKDCKVIVIACNTATAIAVDYLRKKYNNIIIVAIEPAYKMVHDFSYDGETLVMATKGTIESQKFKRLVEKYNNHKTKVVKCVGLADIIEEGNKDKINKYLKDNLEKYKGKFQNVVLGCTHYPLIQEEIIEVLGKNINCYNGAPFLAKHLKDVLEENNLCSDKEKKGTIEFYNSDNLKEKEKRFFEILNRKE